MNEPVWPWWIVLVFAIPLVFIGLATLLRSRIVWRLVRRSKVGLRALGTHQLLTGVGLCMLAVPRLVGASDGVAFIVGLFGVGLGALGAAILYRDRRARPV